MTGITALIALFTKHSWLSASWAWNSTVQLLTLVAGRDLVLPSEWITEITNVTAEPEHIIVGIDLLQNAIPLPHRQAIF